MKKKDGSEIWVEDHGWYNVDENGEILFHEGILRDVTGRKKTEEALQLQSEIVENMQEGAMLIRTGDGVIVYANPAMERISGFTNEEFVGMQIGAINAPTDENPEEILRVIIDSLNTNGNWRGEILNLRKDGTTYWCYANITAFKHTKYGNVRLSIHQDITERKQTEIKLKISEAQKNAILNGIKSNIAFVDKDLKIIWANKTAADSVNKTSEEMIGQTCHHFWANPAEPCKDCPSLKAVETKKSEEIIMNTPDGRVWEEKGEPIFDAEGNLIGVVEIATDVTERKKAEEALRESEENLRKINAEKDKFFSIIAHDLRSPFNGFLGLTEIMAEGLHGMTLDEIQNIAVSMKKSAENLYSLLGNLLEWSLMQRGLTAFEPQLFLLSRKISESMALVTEAADKKEIAISYDIPDDLSVFADANMFEGIIRNLASNAVKFTNKGGVVNIAAKTMPDKTVEISVKDTGIGMDKKMTDNLFRLDIDTSRKGTKDELSSGLGLFICKDFIEKHGGKLWVESEEGKGSVFTFTIPERKC